MRRRGLFLIEYWDDEKGHCEFTCMRNTTGILSIADRLPMIKNELQIAKAIRKWAAAVIMIKLEEQNAIQKQSSGESGVFGSVGKGNEEEGQIVGSNNRPKKSPRKSKKEQVEKVF